MHFRNEHVQHYLITLFNTTLIESLCSNTVKWVFVSSEPNALIQYDFTLHFVCKAGSNVSSDKLKL